MLSRLVSQWRATKLHDCQRPFGSLPERLLQGDRVLVQHNIDSSKSPILSQPLQAEFTIPTPWGPLEGASLIGRPSGQTVEARRKRYRTPLRVSLPSLSDYTLHCPRSCTPVYPQDAERIVSLLDINLPPPPSTLPTSAPPAFEILEAGTGNGALSLFLARALHAANPPPPPSPSPFSNVRNPVFSNPEAEAQWRGSRRAVLYTLDNNSARSAHAAGLIRGFRGGLYAGHVDLHVSDPNTWLAAEHTRRGDEAPFLAHAILDLPAPEAHVAAVGRALRPNGRLVMFVPSVTQLKACWDVVKQHGLPLWHENVFELCAGWTGGREWDVRPTRVRRKSATGAGEAGTEGRMQPAEVELGGEDLQQTDAGSATEGTDADELESASQGGAPPASDSADDTDADGQVWVCRPRVGAMVRGGGFLGVWQKRVNS